MSPPRGSVVRAEGEGGDTERARMARRRRGTVVAVPRVGCGGSRERHQIDNRPWREVTMRGSALMVTVLMMATVTMLGLGFLIMADTELMIASSDRDNEQLVHTAESGLRMVKAWFDQPVTGNPSVSSQVLHKFLATYDMRNPALVDRTKRFFDHDGDANTPMVLA